MGSEHLIPRFTEGIPNFREGVFQQIDLRAEDLGGELSTSSADELGCGIVQGMELGMAIPLVAETLPEFFALLCSRCPELIKIEEAPVCDRWIRIAEPATWLMDAGEMEGRIHGREQGLAY